MKKALALALVLAVRWPRSRSSRGGAEAAPAKQQAGTLVGRGRDVPVPAHLEVDPGGRQRRYGINITYSPTGSGAGIAAITARTVDFGASDAPLSPDQLTACKGCVVDPVGARRRRRSCTTCPGVERPRCGSTAPCSRTSTWARSRTGTTRRSRRSTRSCTLPSTKITPVYRSDGSGTTYNFTDYLSAVSPQWKSKVGINTSVNLPAGVGRAR